MLRLLALNSLRDVDIIFFSVIGGLVALVVVIYFLIPVFNKKQYQEQRDNLKKREVAFKANLKVEAVAEDAPEGVQENSVTATESITDESSKAKETKKG